MIDETRAIAILDEVTRCVKWMETLSEEIKAGITDPKNKIAETCEGYILSNRINDSLEEGRKAIGRIVQEISYKYIPERMLDEGITTFTSAALGFRVSVANRFSASIIPDKKSEAFDWLRKNDLEELIVPQVNAQTLSATARKMLEDENKELPEELFKTSTAPYTSVTKVAKK